ncbi:upstream stimulatory factor 2-like [Sycon ciliatum]|uniref:upstream stimulatory factor 2-like n=1 Tax=Sycon ciliatum TaxID=27933 RepID=UPI0031F62CD1|eukprot:scpid88813/ scgid25905/ Upstream stimulatory factor 2; Class B basic helix-loop-helix protein 12; FOS-interacting protein; Major late transcription factor 2; Upstream transcription factor 2
METEEHSVSESQVNGKPAESEGAADAQSQEAQTSDMPNAPSTPPISVFQSAVPSETAITAVPLVHVQNRLQVSPVLVPSASSAFQTAAVPGSGQQDQCSSSVVNASPSTADAAATEAAAISTSSSSTNGNNTHNNGCESPMIQHQQQQQQAQQQQQQHGTLTQILPSVSTGGSDRLPSPAALQQAQAAVAGGGGVAGLPPGPFYFMLQNAPGTVPTIAPRPSSSEALPSPSVVTTAVRPDGSPVAMVAASPTGSGTQMMDVESPGGTLTPMKRGRSCSPRESKRRAVHNEVERRRRDKINFWMDRLKEIVPNPPMAGGTNTSKGHMLGKSVTYITELKDELAALKKRYESEHSQLLQCASQHTLLRQQLLESGLKPTFNLFRISTPNSAGGNGAAVSSAAATAPVAASSVSVTSSVVDGNKLPEVIPMVAASASNNVMQVRITDVAQDTPMQQQQTVRVLSPQPVVEQPMRSDEAGAGAVHPPPLIQPSLSQLASPPPLTPVVTKSAVVAAATAGNAVPMSAANSSATPLIAASVALSSVLSNHVSAAPES